MKNNKITLKKDYLYKLNYFIGDKILFLVEYIEKFGLTPVHVKLIQGDAPSSWKMLREVTVIIDERIIKEIGHKDDFPELLI